MPLASENPSQDPGHIIESSMQRSGFSRFLLPAAIGCLFVAVPLPGNCQVYVGSAAAGGTVTLSNFQSSEAPELLLPALMEVAPVKPGVAKAETRQVTSIPAKAERLRDLIESVAGAVNVAPRLIHAVTPTAPKQLGESGAISPRSEPTRGPRRGQAIRPRPRLP